MLSFQLFLNFFCIGQNHSFNEKEQQKLLRTETRVFNKTLRFSGNQTSCLKIKHFPQNPTQDRLMKLYEILESFRTLPGNHSKFCGSFKNHLLVLENKK